jgi:hypothetical protein
VRTPLQAGWTFSLVAAAPAAMVTLLWEGLVAAPGGGLQHVRNRVWFPSRRRANKGRADAATGPVTSATRAINMTAVMARANMIADKAGLVLYKNLSEIWGRNRVLACYVRPELLALLRITAGNRRIYVLEGLPDSLLTALFTSSAITGEPRFVRTDITLRVAKSCDVFAHTTVGATAFFAKLLIAGRSVLHRRRITRFGLLRSHLGVRSILKSEYTF